MEWLKKHRPELAVRIMEVEKVTILTITIDCDNATFEDGHLYPEVARILRHLADNMDDEDVSNIYDAPECPLLGKYGEIVGVATWANE